MGGGEEDGGVAPSFLWKAEQPSALIAMARDQIEDVDGQGS